VNADDLRLGTKSFYRYPERPQSFKFQPRDQLLLRLKEAMVTERIIPKNSSRSIVLYGLGGSGKTQLALEYCSQCENQKTVSAIFWANASTKASMKSSFDEIWEFIRPTVTRNSETMARKIDSVKKTLSSWSRPWLLVLDNYDDLNGFPGIMEFIPQSKFGRILFTSRLQGLPRRHDTFDHEIPVEGLDDEVAVEMLFSRSQIATEDRSPEIERHARTLLKRLGNLPLAIDQAAAYMAHSEDTLETLAKDFDSVKAYVLRILANDLSYVKSDPGRREELASIYSAWELSFRLIRNEDPRTPEIKGHVLSLLSYLDARNISDEIFAEPLIPLDAIGERLFRERPISKVIECFVLPGRTWDLYAFYFLIGELTTLSLIHQFGRSQDRKHRVFSVHPLVRDWIKIRSNADDREKCFLLAVTLLHACVTAQQSSSAGQQMSRSSELEIQILRHLEALDADARLEMKSAMPGSMFETLLPLIQQMSKIMTDIREEGLRQQMRELGRWLFAKDPYQYHRSILNRAVPGTGSRVLDSPEFAQWGASSGPSSILWLVGPAGTGKTFATAATISYLENVLVKRAGSKYAVIFFYLRDASDPTRLLREIFGSLLKLLFASQGTETLLNDEVSDVRKLYEEQRAGKVSDELPVIFSILQRGISKLQNCYIIFDDLDVLPSHLLETLFSNLRSLLSMTCIKLMIASRHTVLLKDLLKDFEMQMLYFDKGLQLDAEKSNYIRNRVSIWTMKQKLKDRIEEFILGQSHKRYGFFVLADCATFPRTDPQSLITGNY
jgi:Cdc6-like AAA superfamily ATPase